MSRLDAIIGFLESLPATFWGVVVGALISLGGVMLTNQANNRRLRIQFAHDRALRLKEHELALRKEIHLAAAEALLTGIMAITKFADLNLSADKITEDYTAKAPAIAKMQIIASEKTWKAVTLLYNELSAACLRLSAKRAPLVLQWQAQAKAAPAEQKPAVGAVLYAAAVDLGHDAIEEMIRLSELFVPVILAIREELGFAIDEAGYRRIVQEGIAKQRASLDDFVTQAQNHPIAPLATEPKAAAEPLPDAFGLL